MLCVCLAGSGSTAAQATTDDWSDWKTWLDNQYYKIHLEVRPRIELADFEGLDGSQAYTMRTRLGIGSKPFYGFSGYVEMENVFAIERSDYWDMIESPTGQSPIPDPDEIELNRGWLRFHREEWLGIDLKGGRQRIILDNARFIGNVAWRQHEQTFDAAHGVTTAGVEDLSIEYDYLWKIHRIFGNKGGAGTRDWNSDSHVAHVHYGGFEALQVSAFAYLLDFEKDAPQNSSNSYGFRATGTHPIVEDWSLAYAGSFAYQSDAANNPLDYDAIYGAADVALKFAPLGSVAIGFEHLGSDDGRVVFVTPLATAHKFNGLADAFLDNGGPNGLEDLYVSVSPRLPWKLGATTAFHQFWSDYGGYDLGWEVDTVVTRPLLPGLTALVMFAWFDGTTRGPADRWRLAMQLDYLY